MTDSQNAHNPDKTQPLDAMPAAPKPAPAQMELLKPAAPDEPKHSHDKTQPLHIIPPASLAPPAEPAKAAEPAVTPPPASEHQPEKTQPIHAMPPAAATAPASTHQDAAKPAEAVATPPPPAATPTKRGSEKTRPPVPPSTTTESVPAHTSAVKSAAPVATSASPQVDAAKPATSPVAASPSPQVDAIKTSTAPVKSSTASATVPPRQAITRPLASQVATPPLAQPSMSASPPSHSEPAKTPAPPSAPKDYVKTVGMMAASPPPASAAAPAAEPIAPPDIEQLRPKPSSPVGDRFRWMGHKIATTAFVAEILPGAAAKLGAYAALTRLNKPIGIWLLLWPVLWALWLSSGGKPDPHVFIVFVLGTILTRSAGCAINDFADRKFDGHVKRTKDRPLVTGAVDPVEALALCAGLGLIALGLALTLNQLAQQLTLIGGVLVLTYPFFKRFFPLPQAYLGIAFTWSVPMAYAAQTGAVPRSAYVMFMAGLLWTVAYDTMYAMVDREDDKKLGIRSSALLFGDADRFIIGIMQLMTLLGLWLIGDEMELGLWYGLGLAFAAVFALYQQLLIRKRKPEDCFKAFINNNYFGMSVFIGILLEYTFR